MLHAQPALPMGRAHIADIGHALVRALALQEFRRCRHAPSRLGELPAARFPVSEDRGRIIWIDARLRRQVPRHILDLVLQHVTDEDAAHRVLALGLGIQIAHRRHSQRIGTGSDREEQCQNEADVGRGVTGHFRIPRRRLGPVT